jgi:hypothetical protein
MSPFFAFLLLSSCKRALLMSPSIVLLAADFRVLLFLKMHTYGKEEEERRRRVFCLSNTK